MTLEESQQVFPFASIPIRILIVLLIIFLFLSNTFVDLIRSNQISLMQKIKKIEKLFEQLSAYKNISIRSQHIHSSVFYFITFLQNKNTTHTDCMATLQYTFEIKSSEEKKQIFLCRKIIATRLILQSIRNQEVEIPSEKSSRPLIQNLQSILIKIRIYTQKRTDVENFVREHTTS